MVDKCIEESIFKKEYGKKKFGGKTRGDFGTEYFFPCKVRKLMISKVNKEFFNASLLISEEYL